MTRGDAVALAAAGLFTGAASLAGAATNGPPLRVVAVAAAQETVNADLAQRGAKLARRSATANAQNLGDTDIAYLPFLAVSFRRLTRQRFRSRSAG